EQLADLVEGESEPLGDFDHSQRRDDVGPVHPVAAEAAARFLDQSAPLVVTQRLQVHPSGLRDGARPQAATVGVDRCHASPPSRPATVASRPATVAARAANPSSTATRAAGTRTRNRTSPSCAGARSKRKNEQQAVSSSASSAARS